MLVTTGFLLARVGELLVCSCPPRDECVAELRRFDVDIQAGMRCTDSIHQNNVRLKFPLCSASLSASRFYFYGLLFEPESYLFLVGMISHL